MKITIKDIRGVNHSFPEIDFAQEPENAVMVFTAQIDNSMSLKGYRLIRDAETGVCDVRSPSWCYAHHPGKNKKAYVIYRPLWSVSPEVEAKITEAAVQAFKKFAASLLKTPVSKMRYRLRPVPKQPKERVLKAGTMI